MLSQGWIFLGTLLAVSVGAVLAGLPNRKTTQRLTRLEQQQSDDNRRFLNIILANGDLNTYQALQSVDVSTPQDSVALDQDELAMFQAGRVTGEEEYGFDDALHLPEFPLGPNVRYADTE